LSPTFDRSREEVTGKSGELDRLDTLRWSGDKSCRVAVMEIGERHDTTDFLGQASASTNHIDC